MGFVKDTVNTVTSPFRGAADKVGGVFGVGEFDPNRSDYLNPYLEQDRGTDLSRSSFYNNQSKDAFKDLSKQGDILNKSAKGYSPLIAHLVAMGNGQGPSLAQMQLQEGTNNNIQNQYGIAASNPNINPAMAMRVMGQNIAGLNQTAAGQSGQLRLQEQMDAMNKEIAARQAQGQGYGMAGDLMGNRASLSGNYGLNYADLAQKLAENERQGKIAFNTADQGAFNAGQTRRGEFWSKIGQAGGLLA